MLTINALVAMISIACTGERMLDRKLECFDHYNNCMIGEAGFIKPVKEFYVCKKKWENK